MNTDPSAAPEPGRLQAQQGNAASGETWDRQYRNGEWDYLESEDEAAHYRAIAAFYAAHGKDRSVLDVGCGTGTLYRHLVTDAGMQASRYTGIDLSAEAVRRAAQRYPQADFRQLDYAGASLELRFGCVVFNETLYCFDDPLAVLEKCARENLEGDAVLIISMYGDHHEDLWKGVAMHYPTVDETEVENDRQVRWKIKAVRRHP